MPGLTSILSLFSNEFNKFNNTRAQMLYFIYHMIFRLNLNLMSAIKIIMYAMFTLLWTSFHTCNVTRKPVNH